MRSWGRVEFRAGWYISTIYVSSARTREELRNRTGEERALVPSGSSVLVRLLRLSKTYVVENGYGRVFLRNPSSISREREAGGQRDEERSSMHGVLQ